MSYQWYDRVWDREYQSHAMKLAMLALAKHANGDGYCFPGQKRIARLCGISERHLRRVLERLERNGDLVIANRGRSKGYIIVLGQTELELRTALQKHLDLDAREAEAIARGLAIPDTMSAIQGQTPDTTSGSAGQTADTTSDQHRTPCPNSGHHVQEHRTPRPPIPDIAMSDELSVNSHHELPTELSQQQLRTRSGSSSDSGNGSDPEIDGHATEALELLEGAGVPSERARPVIAGALAAGWDGATCYECVAGWLDYAASDKGASIKAPGFLALSRLQAKHMPPAGEDPDPTRAAIEAAYKRVVRS